MNLIRSKYNNLPFETRQKIKSSIPVKIQTWHAHYSLPMGEDVLFLRVNKRFHPDIPRITVIHEDRPMHKTPHELETGKERYKTKKVIFLVRDPRDVVVSSYFEEQKRSHLFRENINDRTQPDFVRSIHDFIFGQRGGIDTILKYYNIWAKNRSLAQDFLLIRYEDMQADSPRELRRTLSFLGLGNIDDATIHDAVNFASFDNMRAMERKAKFKSGLLNPGDREDDESYKTRKGNVGGYKKYLNQDEIERINHKIEDELAPFYGYAP